MNRIVRPLLLLASLQALALVGCNKDEKAAEPPALPAAVPAAPAATTAAATAAAAPAAPAAATSVAANTAAPGDLPTSTDYEQAALDEINPQNIESELDKLEKEIAQ